MGHVQEKGLARKMEMRVFFLAFLGFNIFVFSLIYCNISIRKNSEPFAFLIFFLFFLINATSHG
jgi:hypothetical protein